MIRLLYDLDPAHFNTAYGLTWQAALNMIVVELELLADPNIDIFN